MAKPIDKINTISCSNLWVTSGGMKGKTTYHCCLLSKEHTVSDEPCSIIDEKNCFLIKNPDYVTKLVGE